MIQIFLGFFIYNSYNSYSMELKGQFSFVFEQGKLFK